MQDEIEIKLPVSGKTVVVRNYTNRADDLAANAVLYRGVDAEQSSDKKGSSLKFPIANVMESQAVYVNRLVKSIDGSIHGIEKQLNELRSEDYEYLENAVTEITEAHSPKASTDKNA